MRMARLGSASHLLLDHGSAGKGASSASTAKESIATAAAEPTLTFQQKLMQQIRAQIDNKRMALYASEHSPCHDTNCLDDAALAPSREGRPH